MSDPHQLLRRNFVVVFVAHAAMVAALFFAERWLPDFQKPFATPVQLVVPADILGELPQGPGRGRGAYAPPKETAAPARGGGTPEAAPPPGKTQPLAAPPKPSLPSSPPSDGIGLPKTTAKTAKPPVKSQPLASAKTATTKTASSRDATQVASASSPGLSAEQSRAGFLNALRRYGGGLVATEGGTPFGDNRPAGGGTGRGRIGSPDGAEDGVPGGIGQGSPNWRYYLHVRDRLYEAWDQPGALQDRKLVAVVVIEVARDGSLVRVTLKRSSGNKQMDNSALAAVRKVRMFEPPPDTLVRGSTAEIVVDFQMEG